jgi:hypothetical protein
MNVKLVANDIISKSVRIVSKKKFSDKLSFEKQVNKFISSTKSNSVKLKLRNSSFREDEKTKRPYQHWKLEFDVVFSFEDPYVDNKVYEAGTVHIFPSKKLYDDVNKSSLNMFEAYPEWETTGITATITGKARNY